MGISANWSRENLAWAGGYFEGEGCILISGDPKKQGRSLRIKATSTDLDTLTRFRDVIGAGVINGPYVTQHYKPKWYYAASGGKAYAAIVAMWPFLGERRKAKAEECISVFSKQRRFLPRSFICGAGHERTKENTALWSGRMYCKVCSRIRNAAKYDKKTPIRKRGFYKKKNNVPVELQQSSDRNRKRAAQV